MITKFADVDFDPTAPAPLWQAFLSRVMNENAELVSFLQRAAGYSLVREGGLSFGRVKFLVGHDADRLVTPADMNLRSMRADWICHDGANLR